MKVSELYNHVAQLGFEDSLDNDTNFYNAANRALLQVASIRPAIRSCVVNHHPLKNEVANSSFTPVEKNDDLIYEAESAKAYYFEADGNGTAIIEKRNSATGAWSIIGSVTLSSNKVFAAYKGLIQDGGAFVSGAVRIRFAGDYLYYVKNVALYKQLYSATVNDIPAYEPLTKYDISSTVNDFMSLVSPPISEGSENDRLNQDYEIESNQYILLPNGKPGTYKVLYRHKTQPITDTGDAQNDDTDIDLDDELCAILPYLVASNVWADDEPDKAEYYMAIYRERAADIERRDINVKPVHIKNKSGW